MLEGAFAAIERLLERTAEQRPIVIVIEDLHWIDDASKAVLDRSLAETDSARVMFVTTHRPDHHPTWRSNAAFTQLRLRPLPEAEAVRIISARAGGAVPHELEKRILKKADGNPFYLEELTRALVEDGTLVAREGIVRATRNTDEIRIPDTIGELLGARIDRLSPAAKRVAQVASVLGRQFPRAHVEKLLEGEPIDVLVELGELERRGILHRSGMDLGELRFGESLTQEVAYEGLLMRERRGLHDRAAALFEADGRDATRSGDGRRSLALAAHHLARGEDRARGIEALIQAAIEAQALPSYGDSIRLYREAWELADTMLRERRGGSEDGKAPGAARGGRDQRGGRHLRRRGLRARRGGRDPRHPARRGARRQRGARLAPGQLRNRGAEQRPRPLRRGRRADRARRRRGQARERRRRAWPR